MKTKKLLVACEESQRVCISFRSKGGEAYSCDIIEPSGGYPEWHIKQDVLPLLNGSCSFKTMDGVEHTIEGKGDMIIAFPPCIYLTNAGAVRLLRKVEGYGDDGRMVNIERLKNGILARDFFMAMLNADCDKVAVENPVPTGIYCMPKYTQIIQPYYFGEPYKKRTCLGLKGLPQLTPTDEVKPIMSGVDGGSKKADGSPRDSRGMTFRDSENKSKTFGGIAQAMAEQGN